MRAKLTSKHAIWQKEAIGGRCGEARSVAASLTDGREQRTEVEGGAEPASSL